MQTKKLIISLFFIFLFANAFAQDSLNVQKCWLCKNNRHTALSPYNYSWKHETPYLILSGGLVLSGIVIDQTNPIEPYTIAGLDTISRNNVNPFDRNATYNWDPGLSRASDILLLGSVLSPLLFLTTKSTKQDFGWLVLMAGEVMSINYGLMTTVKNLTNRPRPYVYNYDDAPLDERTSPHSLESFYSGHVSTTAAMSFFVATVLTQYHPDMKTGWKITVWAVAAAYPAVTAYLRVASGKHYPTDVMVGYAVGAFTGWLVPFLHKKKDKKDKFSFAPTAIYGHAGVYLAYKF